MEIEPMTVSGEGIADAEAEYIKRCEKECIEWKENYKQSNKACRLALAEKEKKEGITYSSVEAALTEEEKQFLAARPNYQKLLQKARDVSIQVKIASETRQEAALKAQATLQKAEQKMNDVIMKIADRPLPFFQQ